MLTGPDVGKRDGTKVEFEYKAAIQQALKPLGELNQVKPGTLAQCFQFLSSDQQLGSDGYYCLACNEGEQLNASFVWSRC